MGEWRLVEVQIDAEQDQRPQNGAEQRRAPALQGVQVSPVVVGARDDPADDQVQGGDPADADAGCGSCCITHEDLPPFSFSSERTNGAGLWLLAGRLTD